MSEPGRMDLEALLADALRPIEPPEDLASRVETTLSAITEQAAAALGTWAEELSESELQSLRDPRNWVRPVAAVAVGGAAAGALVVVGARRRRKPTGLRANASRVISDLGGEHPPLGRCCSSACARAPGSLGRCASSRRRASASPRRPRGRSGPRIRWRKLSSVFTGTRSRAARRSRRP